MTTCSLCNGKLGKPVDSRVCDYEYGAPGEYSYRQCTNCSVLCIKPIPDRTVLNLAYPPEYHAYKPHTSPLAAFLKQRYWRRVAKAIIDRVGRNVRILDVGCAFGDLLSALNGMGVSLGNLYGVDYSSFAVEAASRKGLNVFQGELDEIEKRGLKFNVVVMINMIEHVYEPADTLKQVTELLLDDGIVVGETPNYQAWDRQLFGRYWGGYHTPRHLTIFNYKSLELLAHKSGLKVSEIKGIVQPAHWALSVQNCLTDRYNRPAVKGGRSALFIWLILATVPLNIVQLMVSRVSSVSFVFKREAIKPL